MAAMSLALACGTPETGSADDAASNPGQDARTTVVRPGIQVLLQDSLNLLRERRLGLITNQTGVARAWDGSGAVASSIDLLSQAPEGELVALFSPEHGIRGTADPGEAVASDVDARTGVPIHSLYGETRKPTPEMLEGVDLLLFDIQDVGARYYTYVWTMALAMEAAGEAGIPFVVLDRPNPIGGDPVQGNVLDPELATFVGLYPVTMRHGLTPGELARMVVGAWGVEVELHVMPLDGWSREMDFASTGLPWVAPSPNMPDEISALHYPGTCLFEGTNLSVARGTDRPFQQVGAPFLDGAELARRLNDLGLPGTEFEATRFTPRAPGDGKYDGQDLSGVRFKATGPSYDPTVAALATLLVARRMAGDAWEWRPAHFDRLAGDRSLRGRVDAGAPLDSIAGDWRRQAVEFAVLREPYLIYPRP